jgi:phosphocarrier protein HPr
MIEQNLTIKNRAGLHTRPAAMLVKLAARFKSDIYLERDGYGINAKSIIGVMTLAAEQGSELLIRVEGEDEQLAFDELSALFESGFGEL